MQNISSVSYFKRMPLRSLAAFVFTLLIFACTPKEKGKHIFLLQTTDKKQLTPTEFADYETKLRKRLLSLNFDDDDISITQQNTRIRVEIAQWTKYEQALTEQNADLNLVRSLLQTTGKISIWNTYSLKELVPCFNFPDTVSTEKRIAVLSRIGSPLDITYMFETVELDFNSPVFANTSDSDTANVRALCDSLRSKGNFPTDLQFIWDFRLSTESDRLLDFIAVKADRQAFYLRPAAVSTFGPEAGTGRYVIELTLSEDDKRWWEKITQGANDKSFALRIDQLIYVCPLTSKNIYNGQISINGFITSLEMENMNACLNNPFANPIQIVEEKTEL
jgi:hypothetical protein